MPAPMPAGRRFLALSVVALAAACSAGSSATISAEPGTRSPLPILPTGVPSWFDEDLPSGDVPVRALVPEHTAVTGTWYGETTAGESIVVAWEASGSGVSNPFARARGLAVWRRFDDGGAPWRPVYGLAYPKASRVLGISAVTGDVTGDGSDDALVLAATGGSGACGTYAVIDLKAASPIFRRSVCDTTIDPSVDPPGLSVVKAEYAKGDPHCCPSAVRTSVLTYTGDGSWTTRSSIESPTS
jgi:hypothetical protein